MSYNYSVPHLEIWEFLPQGQSLESWRDMVTVQAFLPGDKAAPQAVLTSIAERARTVCPEVLHSPVTEERSAGYPAAHMALLCLHDANRRRGDLVLYRAIRDGEASYVLSRSRRDEGHQADARDLLEKALAGWRAELEGFRVCRDGRERMSCSSESADVPARAER